MEELMNFEKGGGLIPAIIQDHETNLVLMVGYVNPESFSKTLESGYVWYYSRKKKRLWQKGEQSGHVQVVDSIFLDCDNDALLIRVKQKGGACDLGYKSCFHKVLRDGRFVDIGEKIFDPKQVYDYSEDIALCFPSGSLADMTERLFKYSRETKPGIRIGDVEGKYSLNGYEGNISVTSLNPRDIPKLVENGTYDCGITGKDCLIESEANVTMLGDLRYNKLGIGEVLWVLAVRTDLDFVRGVKDFNGSSVWSGIPNITRQLFNSRGVKPRIRLWEDKTGLGDDRPEGIVVLTETGETIKSMGYRVLDTVMSTSAVFIASNSSLGYTWKRERIEGVYNSLHEALCRIPSNPKKLMRWDSLWPVEAVPPRDH